MLTAPKEIRMDAETLRQMFRYDAETGVLSWAVRRNIQRPGDRAGRTKKGGYRAVKINGKDIAEHRLIWLLVTGEWPRQEIDHINGNPQDNRMCNLRDVSPSLNQQNMRYSQGASGFLGVTWHKRCGKWQAQIKAGEKLIYLGLYDAPERAHAAYVKAKRELHPGGML